MFKIIGFIVCFMFGMLCGNVFLKNVEANDKLTTLEIYNPFNVSIFLETKCDNIAGTLKYRYYNKIKVPKKGSYKLIVPNNLRYCEIWGLDFKLF